MKADLGRIYVARERLTEAETLLRDTLDRARRTLGADHRITLKAVGYLASELLHAGKPLEAGQLLKPNLAGMRETFHPKNQTRLAATYDMARVRIAEGKTAEAVEFLSSAVDAGYVYNWPDRDGRIVHGRPGVLQDPLLVALHGHPGFEEAVGSTSWGAAIDDAIERVQKGDREGAIRALHLALDRGCIDPRAVEANPRFSSLHGESDFAEVVARLRENRRSARFTAK